MHVIAPLQAKDWQGLPLQGLAQRFIVGWPSAAGDPVSQLAPWLAAGMGGVIGFRANYQGLSALEITTLHQRFQQAASLPLWISVDQEGGPVERFSPEQALSIPSPMALSIAEAQGHAGILGEAAMAQAQSLAALGITMNYVPCLDVQHEPQSPIIGVRAYGCTPEAVLDAAAPVVSAYHAAGVLTVGKHFPGHGGARLDSHETLPTVTIGEADLAPFRWAVSQQLPAIMVAHLRCQNLDAAQPTSGSPSIIQQLLRVELGYTGLVMSDDMAMGAIPEFYGDPLKAAIATLNAGCDVLIWRQADEGFADVMQGLVQALDGGELDPDQHSAALGRIAAHRPKLPNTVSEKPPGFNLASQSQALAERAVSWLQPPHDALPAGPWLVIEPDRASIHHYAADAGPDLASSLNQPGLYYGWQGTSPALPAEQPTCCIFTAYQAHRDAGQQALLQAVLQRWPGLPIVWVSLGLPDDGSLVPARNLAGHLYVGYWRPAAIQAVACTLMRNSKS